MKKSIDIVKVMEIGGAVLTVAATMMTGYAKEKRLDETIQKKVAEAIAEQLKSNNE